MNDISSHPNSVILYLQFRLGGLWFWTGGLVIYLCVPMSNYHSLGPNVPDAVEQKQSANTIGRQESMDITWHHCGFKRESLNAQFRHTCLGCWRPSLSLAEFPVVQCLEKSNSSHQIFWLKSKVYSFIIFPSITATNTISPWCFFLTLDWTTTTLSATAPPQICHTPWSSIIHRWGNLGNVDRGKLAGRIKIHQDPKMSLNLPGVYFQKWLQHLFWPLKMPWFLMKIHQLKTQKKHGEPLQLLKIWKLYHLIRIPQGCPAYI